MVANNMVKIQVKLDYFMAKVKKSEPIIILTQGLGRGDSPRPEGGGGLRRAGAAQLHRADRLLLLLVSGEE